MSKDNSKYFVFQSKTGDVQTEVGRKKRGPGRPPVGPNILKTDDGNVYISDCLTEQPTDNKEYVEVVADDGTKIWYEKTKPASKASAHKYKLENGKLVDEGVAGRGRPATGYVKIKDDLVVDGVNLKGHFYDDGEEPEETEEETEEEEVVNDADADYEEVEEPVDDEEARAFADAAADFAADLGDDYEEIEYEEEETV